MGSRRRLGLFSLVVLAVLCLQPCRGGSDAPALSDNKTDEGGIFGFTLSPLSFLFGSDDDEEINNNVVIEKAAGQDGGDKDSTDGNHGDKDLANDKDNSRGEEEKQPDDKDEVTAASDLKDSDDDEDEGAQMDELSDEDEKFNSKRGLFKKASDGKDASGSRKILSGAAHNSSVALRDSFLCQQTPDLQDLSHYMRTCHNCLVQTDRHSCPLHEAALELKKQMTELQELLSYGCRMGGCREDGRCCHSPDIALLRAVQEMTQITQQMYSLFLESCSSCPRDGGWSEWCEWGACSVTCGEGTRTRSRNCNNPTPKGSGRPCQGPDMDSLPCSSPSCCVSLAWSAWGSWSECAVTCGRGMVERRRSCASPTDPYCPQSQCPGSSVERSQRQCGPNPSDGSWGAWQRWSSCSVSCGRGTRSRTRRCDSPSPNMCGRVCPGESVEREECNEWCPSCEWSPWSPWSTCLVTCGDGLIERSRRCFSPFSADCSHSHCQGPATETRRERCGPYPSDSNWGSWQQWDSCSVTCGSGTQRRLRLCNSPPPNVCARDCPGARMEQRACFLQSCTMPPSPPGPDCEWSTWGSWSACSVTCGDGMTERRRSCFSPRYSCLPSHCQGSGIERRLQMCGPYPSDGSWGAWQQWSSCSVNCGRGYRSRGRRCDSPSPNMCGKGCAGESVEREECNEPCPSCEWGSWSPWSTCLVPCGDGVVERSRRCFSSFSGECSHSHCQGPATETRRERCGPYPIEGNWGQWGPWGACSVSCGPGEQQRWRQCDSPPANECGRPCPGPNMDVQPCREPCGEWGSWEAWCPCDCRKGSRSRRRSCQVRDVTGEVRPVVPDLCGFKESRQDEACDVRRDCPACVRSCRGVPRGTYPSCTSCSNYVTCSNDRMEILSCAQGHEYNAFIGRCVPLESPSCTLRDCVNSCEGQSGRVPSCQSVCSGYFDCRDGRGAEVACWTDQEFNAHSGLCEAPPSPTCKFENSDFMYSDAPGDNYFDIEDKDAEEKYKELLKQNGMAAALGLDVDSLPLFKSDEPLNKTDNKENTAIKITAKSGNKKAAKSSRMSKKDKMKVQCQTDCAGLAPGVYQSCTGCEHYLICTKHGVSRLGRCPSNKVWDDKRKTCRKTSLTCKPSASSELDTGTS